MVQICLDHGEERKRAAAGSCPTESRPALTTSPLPALGHLAGHQEVGKKLFRKPKLWPQGGRRQERGTRVPSQHSGRAMAVPRTCSRRAGRRSRAPRASPHPPTQPVPTQEDEGAPAAGEGPGEAARPFQVSGHFHSSSFCFKSRGF